MQPELMMLADVGNLVQRINGARIDGAGAGYDRDREVSIFFLAGS